MRPANRSYSLRRPRPLARGISSCEQPFAKLALRIAFRKTCFASNHSQLRIASPTTARACETPPRTAIRKTGFAHSHSHCFLPTAIRSYTLRRPRPRARARHRCEQPFAMTPCLAATARAYETPLRTAIRKTCFANSHSQNLLCEQPFAITPCLARDRARVRDIVANSHSQNLFRMAIRKTYVANTQSQNKQNKPHAQLAPNATISNGDSKFKRFVPRMCSQILLLVGAPRVRKKLIFPIRVSKPWVLADISWKPWVSNGYWQNDVGLLTAIGKTCFFRGLGNRSVPLEICFADPQCIEYCQGTPVEETVLVVCGWLQSGVQFIKLLFVFITQGIALINV